VAGANSYTGATVINAGRLVLYQATLSPTSGVSIATNAVLELDFPDTNPVSALTLGGTNLAPGLYSASTHPAFIAGSGSLLVAPPTPAIPARIQSITISGGNLIIAGTNNAGGNGTFSVLTSTDVALPLASWNVLTNGTFNGGVFATTNAVGTNNQRFYILRVP
jgi:hypothetical protein